MTQNKKTIYKIFIKIETHQDTVINQKDLKIDFRGFIYIQNNDHSGCSKPFLTHLSRFIQSIRSIILIKKMFILYHCIIT